MNRLTADELVELTKQAGFELLRQERRQVDLPIPAPLKGRYQDDWLLNNEIMLLLGKSTT